MNTIEYIAVAVAVRVTYVYVFRNIIHYCTCTVYAHATNSQSNFELIVEATLTAAVVGIRSSVTTGYLRPPFTAVDVLFFLLQIFYQLR